MRPRPSPNDDLVVSPWLIYKAAPVPCFLPPPRRLPDRGVQSARNAASDCSSAARQERPNGGPRRARPQDCRSRGAGACSPAGRTAPSKGACGVRCCKRTRGMPCPCRANLGPFSPRLGSPRLMHRRGPSRRSWWTGSTGSTTICESR